MRSLLRTAALVAALGAGSAMAQTTVTGQPANPSNPSAGQQGQPAVTRPNTDAAAPGTPRGTGPTANVPLEAGANSFTEAQVRSRLEEAGFKDVADLRKDDQGIWRGRANQNGRQVTVGFDYKGNVSTQ